MKMKKVLAAMLGAVMVAGCLTGCGGSSTGSSTSPESSAESEGTFDSAKAITVVSREDGSGTRGAFIELFGIEEKDADGKKVDKTISTAEETNSTAVMITSVEGNENAVGYISLGALKNSVKAVKIDGVEPTTDNVKNGTYKVARPFNIAVKDDVNDAAKDFISFIMSKEGQEVINEAGYIGSDDAKEYKATEATGDIVVGGSTSVSPVMEKLIEAYEKVNSNVKIDLQQSDSTSGMTGTIEGVLDIGMASRELKDEEASELTATTIAMDGIAVIVNKNNDITELTADQVKGMYTGTITDWADVK